jgi:hypothetical protein
MEMNGQVHAPAALPPGRERRYPLDMRLGGAQSRSGHGVEEKKFSAPAGNRTLDHQIVQSVASR